MAWRAVVLPDIESDIAIRRLIAIGFYDDADPANVTAPTKFLHRQTYATEAITSLADLQAQVVAEGQMARTMYNRVQAIRQVLPPGSSIAIP